jgi:hypothetical protein
LFRVKNKSIGSSFVKDSRRRKSEGVAPELHSIAVTTVKEDVIDVAILTDTDRKFPLAGMLNELASLGRFIENVQCTPEGG